MTSKDGGGEVLMVYEGEWKEDRLNGEGWVYKGEEKVKRQVWEMDVKVSEEVIEEAK